MIRTKRAHLYLAALSDAGLSGKNNEDNFAVSAYSVSQYNRQPLYLPFFQMELAGIAPAKWLRR